jgi:ABC-type nitrate/sulfonate/bicarbonate transport system substrate-binding protein
MFMRKGIIVLICVAMLAGVGLAGCAKPQEATDATLEHVVLSLDWVPNTNHTGFYVALDKGWYADEGIDLEIQIPSDAAAALKQVAAGNTQFGVSFEDEVTISRANDLPVVSIAAILQHNTSAFAALSSSGITSAADFEGKTYAAFGQAIERPIMAGLMSCAGADVDQVEFVDAGFDVLPALLGGQVDLAWIYEGWEGIQAQLQGAQLTLIPLYGSCLPDYYTPVIIAGESTIADQGDLVRRFLAATSKGYTYAAEHPDEAADILLKYSPESDPDLVRASQEWLSPRYQDDAARWGEQKAEVWSDYTSWMADNDLLAKPIDPEKAYTNEFLPD